MKTKHCFVIMLEIEKSDNYYYLYCYKNGNDYLLGYCVKPVAIKTYKKLNKVYGAILKDLKGGMYDFLLNCSDILGATLSIVDEGDCENYQTIKEERIKGY